jgi:hypothetical protein
MSWQLKLQKTYIWKVIEEFFQTHDGPQW